MYKLTGINSHQLLISISFIGNAGYVAQSQLFFTWNAGYEGVSFLWAVWGHAPSLENFENSSLWKFEINKYFITLYVAFLLKQQYYYTMHVKVLYFAHLILGQVINSNSEVQISLL